MSNTASPVQHATSVHLSSENDDPRQARAELLYLVEQFNALLNNLGSAAFKNTGSNEGEVVTLTEGGVLPQGLQISTASMPTGTLFDFFRKTPPTGWLEANGQSINRQNDEHRDLFSLLFHLATDGESSLTYLFSTHQDEAGAAAQSADWAWNHSISLKLPDLRGRTRIGRGQGTGLTSRVFGKNYGREEVTLIKDHLPNVPLSIKHPVYNRRADVSQSNKFFSTLPASTDTFSYSLDSIDNKTESMGSDLPHNNMPPSFAILACIKL